MPRSCRVHHHPIIGRISPFFLSVLTAERLEALTMMFPRPNITGTLLSIKLALLVIQNHPIAPSLRQIAKPDVMIPVLPVPVAIGPVHPAPSLTKDLLVMIGAAAHTEGVELVETTLIRLPGETATTPGIVALHLSTSQQDMIEDAKIPKALGVHTANHYRQNEESDPTVIPNGYQKPKTEPHMVYDEPEPMPDLNGVSDVPGVWAFQLSRDLPDVLEYSFNVSEEIAAKWNLTRECVFPFACCS